MRRRLGLSGLSKPRIKLNATASWLTIPNINILCEAGDKDVRAFGKRHDGHDTTSRVGFGPGPLVVVRVETPQIGGAQMVDVAKGVGLTFNPIATAVDQLDQAHPCDRLLGPVHDGLFGGLAKGEPPKRRGLGLEQQEEPIGPFGLLDLGELGTTLADLGPGQGRPEPPGRRAQGGGIPGCQITTAPALGGGATAKLAFADAVPFGDGGGRETRGKILPGGCPGFGGNERSGGFHPPSMTPGPMPPR